MVTPAPVSTPASRGQIARAAAVVIAGFLASGLLGLVRSAVFGALFGTSRELDAFTAAQRIPETVYVLVAGGALSSSFLPVFARLLTRPNRAEAWRLASTVLTLTGMGGVLALIVCVVAAPALVPPLLAPNEPPEQQARIVSLTQIMLPSVALFTVSGLLMAVLNANGNFRLPALALSMNNLGQIIGALVFTPTFGITGLAFGAVLGAALHLLVQVPGVLALRRADSAAVLRPSLNPQAEGVREVFTLMLPRLAGLAAVQLNFIINTNLTSGMVEGSRTAFVIAWGLLFFVLGVIAQSVGTAVFPALSALAAQRDYAAFKDRLTGAMRGVLFLAIPATVVLVTLSTPAIALIFERGAWTAESTAAVAWALALFGIGIAGHSLLEVLARAFYALEDTRTPVLIGIASIALNVVLSLLLIRVIGSPDTLGQGAFGGLAIANSIATLLEAAVLWWLLTRRIGALGGGVLAMTARGSLAAVSMGAAIVAVQAAVLDARLELFIAGMVGGVCYFGLAALLRVEEARAVPDRLVRRFLRR
jgi:putative peptidoglycan lipid II flippase